MTRDGYFSSLTGKDKRDFLLAEMLHTYKVAESVINSKTPLYYKCSGQNFNATPSKVLSFYDRELSSAYTLSGKDQNGYKDKIADIIMQFDGKDDFSNDPITSDSVGFAGYLK